MNTHPTRRLLPAILAALLAGALPGAQAQSTSTTTTTTTQSPGVTSSEGSSGASTSGTAASGTTATGATGSRADTASDDISIQNLRAAAQSLREAVQRMAQMPPGDKRTEAMREGNEALMQVQAAMASLPPELLTANVKESDYKKSLEKLKQASDRLHVAANALADQPPGKGRDAAMKKVNQALLQTNEAMLTGLQLAAGSARGQAATSASGASGGSGASSGASGAGGSAAVTGRPGANTVDLLPGSSTGGSGATSDSATEGKR
ncbi:MAG TPA: hypothetical protein VGE12_13870 [Noviherbaspirillum sp.]